MLRFYNIFGSIVLAGVFLIHLVGWSMLPHGRATGVSPKSVRDNPGSYRSVYIFTHHYGGGK